MDAARHAHARRAPRSRAEQVGSCLEDRVTTALEERIGAPRLLHAFPRGGYSPVMSAMTTFDLGSTNKICFSTIATS